MRFLRIGLALLAPFTLTSILTAQGLEVELQRAVQKEIATGNSKAAIAEYKRISERAGSNRTIAAQALLFLAEAHQRLGDTEANRIYERIMRDYRDQPAFNTARLRLNAGDRAAASGLMRRRVWASPEIQRLLIPGRVSPDGQYIVFQTNESSGLIIRELRSGRERSIAATTSGVATNPIWSVDGKQLAFVFWDPTARRSEIRTINFDGSGTRTVPGWSGNVALSGWSPNGARILAAVSEGGGRGRLLWVNLADGRQETVLTRVFNGPSALSPDGRYIALSGVQGASGREIHLIASDGSDDTVISDNPNDQNVVGWLPDGKTVLFVSRRSGTLDLWALPALRDGTQRQATRIERDLCVCGEADAPMITQARANIASLGVTRTGDFYFRLLDFVSDIHIASFNTASNTAEVVPVKVAKTGFSRWPVWSPDGKRIAYVRVPTIGRELSIFDLATGAEKRIEGIARDRAQVCWAGNDSIVWRRQSGQRLEFRRYTISTEVDVLLFDEAVRESVGFGCTYDGTRVVFVNPITQTIVARTVDGNERHVVPVPAGAASSETWALAPGGDEVAFVVSEQQSMSLNVLNLVSGEMRQVTRSRSGDRFLPRAKGVAWSRDGRFLFFSKGREDTESFELFRIAASGAGELGLGLRAMHLSDLDVGPDGKIAFRAGPMDVPQIVAIENISIPTK